MLNREYIRLETVCHPSQRHVVDVDAHDMRAWRRMPWSRGLAVGRGIATVA